MTPERLEELRQMAGAIDGPKSAWMDELIEEVDRLKDQGRTACNLFDDLKAAQLQIETLKKEDARRQAVIQERNSEINRLEDENDRQERLYDEAIKALSESHTPARCPYNAYGKCLPCNVLKGSLNPIELNPGRGVAPESHTLRYVHEWVESAESGTVCRKCGRSYFLKDKPCEVKRKCDCGDIGRGDHHPGCQLSQ